MHIKKLFLQIKIEAIIYCHSVFSGDRKKEGKHLYHSFPFQRKREFIIKKYHHIILHCHLGMSSSLSLYFILNAAALTGTV